MRLRYRLLSIGIIIIICVAMLLGNYWLSKNATESEDALSVLNNRESIHFWYTDEGMADYINNAAVMFGEKTGVRVIPELVSDDNAYVESINQATLHGNVMPDVYLISHDLLEKAYLSGLADEVTDVKHVLTDSYFSKGALASVTYEDKKVAYPLYYETSALLYNQSYLEEWALQQAKGVAGDAGEELSEEALQAMSLHYLENAIPTTMDGLLRFADTFDAPEGVEGIFKWDVSDIFYNYYFVGNYMVVGGENGDNREQININNPETIACLNVYKNLNQFFSIESDTVTYESVIDDFMEGKIVFTIATTDVVARLEQAKAEGIIDFDYGVARMPDPSTELKGRSLSVTGAVAVNGYSNKKEIANEFAAFLVSDFVEGMYKRTGRAPACRRADYENDALQVYQQEYANSIPLPKIIETSNFWIQLEILFSKVWNGDDGATLVQQLAEQINTQLALKK